MPLSESSPLAKKKDFGGSGTVKATLFDDTLSPEDLKALHAYHDHLKKTLNLEGFTTDVINGLVPKLEKGSLTLIQAES